MLRHPLTSAPGMPYDGHMTNKQISRHLRAFQAARAEWINVLVENPGRSDAPQHIISINANIAFLTSLWNWSDESVEFPC